MANQKEYTRKKAESNIKKMVIDRDLCIGISACIAVASETFKLDNENRAVVIDPDVADDDTLMLAAQSCPVKAILLFDKNGKQIYP